jgi:hypothetical protein
MTKFIKSDFIRSIGSEIWVTYRFSNDIKFVARFKHFRPGVNATAFIKFLIANFTVEEYFTALNIKKKAPLQILMDKGYISPNYRRALNAN